MTSPSVPLRGASFAELTTLRVGGPIGGLVHAETAAQVQDLVAEADGVGKPVLVIGGGSNLLVGDEGWPGLVVRVDSRGIEVRGESIVVQAGHPWDDVVASSLDAGLSGLEALSGIPGSAGGTPIQNVGAYGTVTSDVLLSVRLYDRVERTVQVWPVERCGFGVHRDSAFKHTNRYVVLEVVFGLSRSRASAPVRYAQLADRLGVGIGAAADPQDVRAAVIALRSERGMLLDDDDHDTWSVGSFFVNPVLPTVPATANDCPQYPDVAGIKLSAAWLIEHAGFSRGYGANFGTGTVTLSRKHTLAITNRGGASASDIAAFAGHIRAGVHAAFGVVLQPECDLVNCELTDV